MVVKYPDWVLKWKRKGTAIHKIGNNFYLYEIGSIWDKELKRARKITKGYLGRITQDGLIEPGYKRNKVTGIKEYGASKFIIKENQDVMIGLKEYFEDWWREIFVLSVLRLMYRCPLKNSFLQYQDSWLSEEVKGCSFDEHSIHQLLEEVGRRREDIVRFLKRLMKSSKKVVLIDLTHIFSLSENINLTAKGYNIDFDFTPQVNLLFMFSLEERLPIFYRVLPGNVRDVSSLRSTIEESEIKDAIIIGDKGFYSKENKRLLQENGLKYILPLRRDNRLIDYSLMKQGDKSKFEGYFKFGERFIWYYKSREEEDGVVWLYFDERGKAEESQDYLGRIETHPEFGYSIKRYHENEIRFGTIALLTNKKELEGKQVYQYFKSRIEIEILFDTFKNVLQADRSYMRSNAGLESWIFINYLSLIYYYRIYQKLTAEDLLDKYSVNDVILYLSKIRKVKIANHWIDLEIPKPTRKLIDKLKIHIT